PRCSGAERRRGCGATDTANSPALGECPQCGIHCGGVTRMTAYEAVIDRRYRARRSAFIAGQLDNLRIGGYGGTITVRVVQDGVLIRTSRPKRRQRLLRPNSRSVREAAVQAAEEALERLRGGRQHRTDAIPR